MFEYVLRICCVSKDYLNIQQTAAADYLLEKEKTKLRIVVEIHSVASLLGKPEQYNAPNTILS